MQEQVAGRALFERLGFRLEASLNAHARGRDGNPHTLLALAEAGDATEAARLKALLDTDGTLMELNRALSEKIASGEVDLKTPGLSEHLWQTTMDKLAVDQPNYASYKRESGNT